jgi:general secretion pathway protein L
MAASFGPKNHNRMRQRLVIRLNPDPHGKVHWIRLGADGRVEGHAESGSLEAAAAAAEQRQVIGLVPADAVLMLSARIPTQSRQRMLQAVPFALEDQLADDVANLHFAVGHRDKAGDVAVAVVAHERMRAWLEAFADAGLDVEQLYPEVQGLPYEEDGWTLMAEGDGFLLRSGAQSGFGGDLDNLPVLLVAALEESGDIRPQRLIVYSAEAPLEFDGLEIPVENRDLVSTTALLATSLDEREALALRSGPYARRRSLSVQWQRWRIVAALLAAWVLVDTGAALLESWQLRRQVAAVDAQIVDVYRKTFPGPGPVLNPRLQMESRLAALRKQGGGDTGLLRLLDSVGAALVADGSVQVTNITYRNGDLDLEITAGSLQNIDQLARRLGGIQGIRVEVTRASAEGQRALGQLRIEAAS